MDAQVRLLCPATKLQSVAAHLTATRGLATPKPMLQLAALGEHCINRLPGSSRLPNSPSAGKLQANDLSWVPPLNARSEEHVAAASPVEAEHAAAVWHSAQLGPVNPAGQVTAEAAQEGVVCVVPR